MPVGKNRSDRGEKGQGYENTGTLHCRVYTKKERGKVAGGERRERQKGREGEKKERKGEREGFWRAERKI